MVASAIELILALVCLAAAGHIVIRLFDNQRGAGRRDE